MTKFPTPTTNLAISNFSITLWIAIGMAILFVFDVIIATYL